METGTRIKGEGMEIGGEQGYRMFRFRGHMEDSGRVGCQDDSAVKELIA